MTFFSFGDSGILNADTGYASDLWTSSVACFTSLVFTVNLNLMIRMKYITWLHVVSVFAISYGLYLAFIWITNYVDMGWT